jgi:hypothetical protein
MCGECAKREECKKPCDKVNALLWEDNRVMERISSKGNIFTYPQGPEVRFSEITEAQVEGFSGDDVVPWAGSDFRLRQTEVFVAHFFDKVPYKELAERFRVKENTVITMYRQAVGHLSKLVAAMDARREGLKSVKSYNFTFEQKAFLLVALFGFNAVEVGKMFGQDRKMVSAKVKRMSDKYKALFAGG